ncbi:hypothetical protein Q1695_000712 [Nippostrongylus brasiliensis]|nr:hypothetical protein Q1695_000712 [Nippostrongylus brasiliensis]
MICDGDRNAFRRSKTKTVDDVRPEIAAAAGAAAAAAAATASDTDASGYDSDDNAVAIKRILRRLRHRQVPKGRMVAVAVAAAADNVTAGAAPLTAAL